MKQKLSITVEKRLISKIEAKLKQGIFRNKSHVIEYAIKEFLEHRKSTYPAEEELLNRTHGFPSVLKNHPRKEQKEADRRHSRKRFLTNGKI